MPLVLVVLAIAALAAGWWLCFSPYSQVFGAFPYRGKTRRRVIALTFDDGPNEPYTSELADFLAKKHIRATFFQVGSCVERYPEVTRRLFADGHTIANHSLTHRFRNCFLQPTFGREVAGTQAILQKTIGKTPYLFRSPWLWHQPLLMRTLRKQGLRPISGEFGHAFEAFRPSSQRMVRRALPKARPGAILIFHDGFDARGGDRSNSVAAVKQVVEVLEQQGYSFVTVDELLGIAPYQD